MAILIKGMEMPTTCGNCWFCHAVSNEKWHCRLTGKSFASYSVGWGDEKNTGENGQHPYIRRDDCPLIEVPEPHGDLIDRHEAYLRFGKLAETLEERNGYEAGAPYAMAAMFLNNANEFPTVIPAEEDE